MPSPFMLPSDLAKALGFLPDDWWNGMEPALVSMDEDGAGWFWPEETFEGPSCFRASKRLRALMARRPAWARRHPLHDQGDDCA